MHGRSLIASPGHFGLVLHSAASYVSAPSFCLCNCLKFGFTFQKTLLQLFRLSLLYLWEGGTAWLSLQRSEAAPCSPTSGHAGDMQSQFCLLATSVSPMTILMHWGRNYSLWHYLYWKGTFVFV